MHTRNIKQHLTNIKQLSFRQWTNRTSLYIPFKWVNPLIRFKKLFQTSVDSDDDERDWDAFYKALNALYRDKFDLKKDETYYIANASKERNRPMQAHVISSYEDTTAFPVFILEDLKVPYKKRDDALAAAQAFVEMYGPDEDSYEKIRFSTGSPAREIARYISFLSRN